MPRGPRRPQVALQEGASPGSRLRAPGLLGGWAEQHEPSPRPGFPPQVRRVPQQDAAECTPSGGHDWGGENHPISADLRLEGALTSGCFTVVRIHPRTLISPKCFPS
ncbi:PREDICTED: uncharacterized protein LOC102019674 isoform X3 [Chinchilla lanigera]|uniref:uncharacterized protein LOC102019674 isoform X3 n=1 Tax=Chinchilla lanigera TaxID=34839 RepID=UPI000696B9FF|nr:PREDICTED: uncharacterized protein LOC102019674 isoform X3 [Chinchilla lanigera]